MLVFVCGRSERPASVAAHRTADWADAIARSHVEHPLDSLFHPRSVAIVGISSRAGHRIGFLAGLLDQGFDRECIYPVNPNADEIAGLRAYPTLLDCPDPVDHVICMIPAEGTPALLEACIAKGVRSLQLFTAGFGETGDTRGDALQATLAQQAREGGVRVLGPNCMGLYVPDAGLSYFVGFPPEPGSVFIASQSGVNTTELVTGLASRGLRFSKVVSFGNGIDVHAHDLLDYAATDPETRIVVAYVEGVPDGRALAAALRKCASAKPTLVLKGGLTEEGARAAASHTGSLAGSAAIFDALCRQTGALRARSMAELQDLVVAVSTGLRAVRGRGIALLGTGGGHAVLAADAVANAGLAVPSLPLETQEALREFIPVAGSSVRNPVDVQIPPGPDSEAQWTRTVELVAAADSIDALVVTVGGFSVWRIDGAEGADRLAGLQEQIDVPLVAVRGPRAPIMRQGSVADDMANEEAFVLRAHERGLAVFPSVERAAAAIAGLLDWRCVREGLPDLF